MGYVELFGAKNRSRNKHLSCPGCEVPEKGHGRKDTIGIVSDRCWMYIANRDGPLPIGTKGLPLPAIPRTLPCYHAADDDADASASAAQPRTPSREGVLISSLILKILNVPPPGAFSVNGLKGEIMIKCFRNEFQNILTI